MSLGYTDVIVPLILGFYIWPFYNVQDVKNDLIIRQGYFDQG